MSMTTLVKLCTALALAAGAQVALAQNYPAKPVRLVVPFAAGGTTDIIARAIGDRLQKELGQTVIIDNKGGAGGLLGAAEIAKSVPDGYTIGMATVSTTASAPAINPRVTYDPLNDFTPIMNIAATPNVIAVHPSFPAKDYKTFLAELMKHPTLYEYGSSGTGGINHMQMELFKSLTGVSVKHIPYKGSGPALNDTVAGQIRIIFDNLPSALPFIKDGRLVPIVIASASRVTALPNVPTFKEVGLEPANRMAYYGIHGPKGMPKDVVAKIHAALKRALADPAVKARIEDTGSVIVGNTPEAFAQQIEAEFAVYKKTVAEQKLTLE